jgi:ATP-dependent DNA ligase
MENGAISLRRGRSPRSIALDGEVVVPGANGIPDFGALRGAISSAPERLAYYAFDLLAAVSSAS